MTAPPRRRRALVRLLVLASLAMVFLAVPLPGLQFATRSVGAVTPLAEVAPASADDVASISSVADEPVDARSLVTGGDTDTGRFTAIGLTFDQVPDGPVFLRTFDGRGRPGAWREVAVEEEGPDPGTAEARSARPGTEPVWVGAAHGYEVGLARGDAPGAQVVTVHDQVERVTVDATPVAGALNLNITPPMGINSRSAWGARPVTGITYGTTIRMGVVHHSESSNNYSPADVPAILRSIQAFHIDGRGWTDIGYNFVVDKFGGVWEGRAGGINEPVVGAHAIGFNTNTVGVMVIGSYTATNPSSASLESVSQVIGWKMARHGVNPNSSVTVTSGGGDKYPAGTQVTLPRVVGHGDTSSTSCPGQISNFLGFLRVRSQAWTDWLRAISVPAGALDGVGAGFGVVNAVGWAQNPAVDGPALVRLEVAGRVVEGRADRARAEGNFGFDLIVDGVPPGFQYACVTVLSEGVAASDTSLGCWWVPVLDAAGTSPTAALATGTPSAGVVDLSGTSADVDGPAPREVAVEVDGVVRSSAPSAPDGSFSARLTGVPGGLRQVCVIVTNGGAGVTTRAACRLTSVPGGSPFGAADIRLRDGNIVNVSGWAIDPESVAPLAVYAVIDGRPNGFAADWSRPDVALAHPGYGDRRGFVWEAALGRGGHRVCVVASNVWQGADTTLGCRSIVVK
ncbi:MAG: peptidoglycan recognition protein [Microthrixaceae bacterium]